MRVLQVVVQKNPRHRVEVHAPPPLHMRRAVRAAFHPALAEAPGSTQGEQPPPPTAADTLSSESSDTRAASPPAQQDVGAGSAVEELKGSVGGETGDRLEEESSARVTVMASDAPKVVVQTYGQEKGRWSWQQKKAARRARLAEADPKREAKRAKTARKGRKGTRRAYAERYTTAAVPA